MQRRLFGWLTAASLAVAWVNFIDIQPSNATHAGKKHHKCTSHRGKDIVDTASCNGNFKTLTSALKSTGLACTLRKGGQYTVFAPDDEAFAKMPKSSREDLLNDEQKLANVLKYHIVSKKFTAQDLSQIRSVTTLEGDSLMLDNKDGKVIVDGAIVTKPDIKASNGIIHEIDWILVPERGK
jgi:uncharacterized surface protein with fasciclin (FAS1) repeats